ncbi:hypothetical protein MMC06_000692 [Schaereria dolodes]|nr:hypothetical protein [Schaereria dolodes]
MVISTLNAARIAGTKPIQKNDIAIIPAFGKAGAKTSSNGPAELIAQNAALVRRGTQHFNAPSKLLLPSAPSSANCSNKDL